MSKLGRAASAIPWTPGVFGSVSTTRSLPVRSRSMTASAAPIDAGASVSRSTRRSWTNTRRPQLARRSISGNPSASASPLKSIGVVRRVGRSTSSNSARPYWLTTAVWSSTSATSRGSAPFSRMIGSAVERLAASTTLIESAGEGCTTRQRPSRHRALLTVARRSADSAHRPRRGDIERRDAAVAAQRNEPRRRKRAAGEGGIHGADDLVDRDFARHRWRRSVCSRRWSHCRGQC